MAKKNTKKKAAPKKKTAAKKAAPKVEAVAVEVPVEETTPVEDVKEPVAAEEETYKDRLYKEAVELRNKMIKLKTALETNAVPASEVAILTEQYNVMHQYAVILNTRLGRA